MILSVLGPRTHRLPVGITHVPMRFFFKYAALLGSTHFEFDSEFDVFCYADFALRSAHRVMGVRHRLWGF